MEIVKILMYIIPKFGNTRSNPYGKLLVKDDNNRYYKCTIKETSAGDQYINVNRKRYYVVNDGMLYTPTYTFKEV